MEILSEAFPLPQYIFLIQFLFTIDEIPTWSLSPSPINIPHSLLIHN
jgi:hypothetical protein